MGTVCHAVHVFKVGRCQPCRQLSSAAHCQQRDRAWDCVHLIMHACCSVKRACAWLFHGIAWPSLAWQCENSSIWEEHLLGCHSACSVVSQHTCACVTHRVLPTVVVLRSVGAYGVLFGALWPLHHPSLVWSRTWAVLQHRVASCDGGDDGQQWQCGSPVSVCDSLAVVVGGCCLAACATGLWGAGSRLVHSLS